MILDLLTHIAQWVFKNWCLNDIYIYMSNHAWFFHFWVVWPFHDVPTNLSRRASINDWTFGRTAYSGCEMCAGNARIRTQKNLKSWIQYFLPLGLLLGCTPSSLQIASNRCATKQAKAVPAVYDSRHGVTQQMWAVCSGAYPCHFGAVSHSRDSICVLCCKAGPSYVCKDTQ